MQKRSLSIHAQRQQLKRDMNTTKILLRQEVMWNTIIHAQRWALPSKEEGTTEISQQPSCQAILGKHLITASYINNSALGFDLTLVVSVLFFKLGMPNTPSS